jgi:hypothetical protein
VTDRLASTVTATPEQSRASTLAQTLLRSEWPYMLYPAFVVLLVAFSFASPWFLSIDNFLNIGRQTTLASSVAVGALALLSSASLAEAPASCVKGVDLATLGPTSIVGQGPHGEKAASVEVLKLSDAEAEKVKAGHFKVGVSMQTVNLDWSQLQV